MRFKRIALLTPIGLILTLAGCGFGLDIFLPSTVTITFVNGIADFAIEGTVVFDNRDGLGRTRLDSGLSVLTNLDVNDPRCPRLASATKRFSAIEKSLQSDPAPAQLVDSLGQVLADHSNTVDPEDADPFARVCVHAGEYGTRSATIILLSEDATVHYLHADGPPCTTPFEPVRF